MHAAVGRAERRRSVRAAARREGPFPWLAQHEPGNALAQTTPSPSGGRAPLSADALRWLRLGTDGMQMP